MCLPSHWKCNWWENNVARFHGPTMNLSSSRLWPFTSLCVICEKPRRRGYVKPYITHTSPIQSAKGTVKSIDNMIHHNFHKTLPIISKNFQTWCQISFLIKKTPNIMLKKIPWDLKWHETKITKQPKCMKKTSDLM